MAQKALFSILLILPIFSVIQKAVSFFLEVQSMKTVPYSKLSPGDMVDTEFLQKRFGFDPTLLIASVSGKISQTETELLKRRIGESIRESPWIASEVRLHKRFVLSPYIVSAFVSAFVFEGLLQKSFAFLRNLL